MDLHMDLTTDAYTLSRATGFPVSPTFGFNSTYGHFLSSVNQSEGSQVTAAENESQSFPPVYEFSRDFMFYTLALLIPVGLICNTLSVMVFMARSLRNRAASWYLAALAVSDDLSLITIMIDYWLKDDRIGFNTIRTSHTLCVTVTYLSYTTRLLSAWLVTSLTIERFIGVVYPLKRAALSTTSHARKVILSQTLACFVLTSFTVFTIGIVKAPYGTDCDVRPEMSHIYLVFNILFVIFGSIVFPVLIIFTLNMFILNKVYQRRKHFVPRNMRFNGLRQVSYKSPKDYNIATILLVVSTSFVVLNVPYCICWFVLFFHHFKLIGPFGPNATWQLFAAKYITSIPYYLNYGINFGLYNLCARAFRLQFVRLVTCYTCRMEAAAFRRNHQGSDTKPTCLERIPMDCPIHHDGEETIPPITGSTSKLRSYSRSRSQSQSSGAKTHGSSHEHSRLSQEHSGSRSRRDMSSIEEYSHGSRGSRSVGSRSQASRGEHSITEKRSQSSRDNRSVGSREEAVDVECHSYNNQNSKNSGEHVTSACRESKSGSTGPAPATNMGCLLATDTGCHPATDPGCLPVADTGCHPATEAGCLPAADTGCLPAADTGCLPAADTGCLPATDTGCLPAKGTDCLPTPGTDTDCLPTTGTDTDSLPSTDGGCLPVTDTRCLPATDSGSLPASDTECLTVTDTDCLPATDADADTGCLLSTDTDCFPATDTGCLLSTHTDCLPATDTGCLLSTDTDCLPTTDMGSLLPSDRSCHAEDIYYEDIC